MAAMMVLPAMAFGASPNGGYYGTPLRFDPPPVDLPGLPARRDSGGYQSEERELQQFALPQAAPKPARKAPAPPREPRKAAPQGEARQEASILRHEAPSLRQESARPAPPQTRERQEGQGGGVPQTPQPEQPQTPPEQPRRSPVEPPQAQPVEEPAAQPAEKLAPQGKTLPREKPSRLFGTVEFRCVIADLPKWMRVMRLEKESPSFIPSGLSCLKAQVQPRWLKLKASLTGASVMEKARKVNSFFNQWPYKTDRLVWGVEDYWATPCEFMSRSGDCEDYAIAKYYALRDLGVPASQMRVAAIRNSMTGNGHAVLVVFMHDDAYVLDNVTNTVLSHKRLTHYRPLYTVNEEYMWRHVRPVAGPGSRGLSMKN
jgi:predicted transglutaminase-like cysteine proteinase